MNKNKKTKLLKPKKLNQLIQKKSYNKESKLKASKHKITNKTKKIFNLFKKVKPYKFFEALKANKKMKKNMNKKNTIKSLNSDLKFNTIKSLNSDLKFNTIKTKVNLDKLRFNTSKKIGEGAFGQVYDLHNNKRTNKKYVVKKSKNNLLLNLVSFLFTGKTPKNLLDKEVNALLELSKIGISPKVYFYNKENMTYVIEKLDYSLREMVSKKMLSPTHIKELISLLRKIQQTNIVHNDLHSGNIMFSKRKNKFYIIDLGIFKVVNKCIDENNNSNENGRKQNKIKKSKICYNFNKDNAFLLADLFLYIGKKLESKDEPQTIKKQYEKILNELVELFNIDIPNFKQKLIEQNS